MTRVKRGTISLKRRRNILKLAKGYRFARRNKERFAKQAIIRAGQHAFAHRRDKKGDFRRLWQIKINAGVRKFEMPYSKFMGLLKQNNIGLNRKILADLAERRPETFAKVVDHVK